MTLEIYLLLVDARLRRVLLALRGFRVAPPPHWAGFALPMGVGGAWLWPHEEAAAAVPWRSGCAAPTCPRHLHHPIWRASPAMPVPRPGAGGSGRLSHPSKTWAHGVGDLHRKFGEDWLSRSKASGTHTHTHTPKFNAIIYRIRG